MPPKADLAAWGQSSIPGDTKLRWHQFGADELEREYSPSSSIGGNYHPFLIEYTNRSKAARQSAVNFKECRYGPRPSNTIDLILPAANGEDDQWPLVVFIHGGYWQELSKRESVFAAPEFLRQNIAFAAIDYTLAPDAGIPEIVDECRTAIRWLYDSANDLGYDPELIFVSGSSAGAHLAAMSAIPDSNHGHVLPAGLALVSGIFDLEPIVGTSINIQLKMDEEVARNCSPMLQDVSNFPPTVVAWGEVEPEEFKRQSRGYAAKLNEAGVPVRALEIPSRNHFDVIFDLADTATNLGTEVANLIRIVQQARTTE